MKNIFRFLAAFAGVYLLIQGFSVQDLAEGEMSGFKTICQLANTVCMGCLGLG